MTGKETVLIRYRITEDTKERLETESARLGVPLASLVRTAITENHPQPTTTDERTPNISRTIRVTEQESQELKTKAQELGLSTSEYLRHQIQATLDNLGLPTLTSNENGEETYDAPDLKDLKNIIDEATLLHSLGYLTHTWNKGFNPHQAGAPYYDSEVLERVKGLQDPDISIFTKNLISLGYNSDQITNFISKQTPQEYTPRTCLKILHAYTVLSMGNRNQEETAGAFTAVGLTIPLILNNTLYYPHRVSRENIDIAWAEIQKSNPHLTNTVSHAGTINLEKGTIRRWPIEKEKDPRRQGEPGTLTLAYGVGTDGRVKLKK